MKVKYDHKLILDENVNIYYDFNYNKLYLKGFYGFTEISLSKKCFLKKDRANLSVLLTRREFFRSLLKNFIFSYKSLFNLYYLKIKKRLFGL